MNYTLTHTPGPSHRHAFAVDASCDCGVMLSTLVQSQEATIRNLLAALELNWKHTDDSGRVFWCNCPHFRVLADNAEPDDDNNHSTGCADARVAICKARGQLVDNA